MPTIVLTPEEFAKLPWYARQKVVNAQLREQRRHYDRPSEQSAIDWADSVREEARRLLSAMPPDENAHYHRKEWL